MSLALNSTCEITNVPRVAWNVLSYLKRDLEHRTNREEKGLAEKGFDSLALLMMTMMPLLVLVLEKSEEGSIYDIY